MASRAAQIRPLIFTPLLRPSPPLAVHPPFTSCRTFILHPSRPRLPYLLRPSLSHPLTPHLLTPHLRHTLHSPPTRRLISARTKAYLWRETVTAARIVLYGYAGLLLAGGIFISGVLFTTESKHPTPSVLPFKARCGIALARSVISWTQNYPAAIDTLCDVVSELDTAPSKNPSWTSGYIGVLRLLAELHETNGDHAAARIIWSRIIALPCSSADALIQVGAAFRVAKIAEFQQDLSAAQDALEAAVGFAVPSRGLQNLPSPASAENTGLLLKAMTELGVFHARHGREELALDLFTRVLAARRSAGPPLDPESVEAADALGDPCAEAATMTYIGEVLFAIGKRHQGIAWSREAFETSVGLAEVRGRCKECAIVVGKNLSAMVALMKEEEGKEEKGWKFFRRETEVVESAEKWEEAVKVLESIRATKTL